MKKTDSSGVACLAPWKIRVPGHRRAFVSKTRSTATHEATKTASLPCSHDCSRLVHRTNLLDELRSRPSGLLKCTMLHTRANHEFLLDHHEAQPIIQMIGWRFAHEHETTLAIESSTPFLRQDENSVV
jgi:hypothetical protein